MEFAEWVCEAGWVVCDCAVDGEMVHIVLTTSGLEEVIISLKAPGTLWLNAGVGTVEQVSHLRASGWDISTWTNPIDFEDAEDLEGAVSTVWRHHPNTTIWLEKAVPRGDDVE